MLGGHFDPTPTLSQHRVNGVVVAGYWAKFSHGLVMPTL